MVVVKAWEGRDRREWKRIFAATWFLWKQAITLASACAGVAARATSTSRRAATTATSTKVRTFELLDDLFDASSITVSVEHALDPGQVGNGGGMVSIPI